MQKDFSESDSVGADATLYNYNEADQGSTMRMFVHKQLNKLGIVTGKDMTLVFRRYPRCYRHLGWD